MSVLFVNRIVRKVKKETVHLASREASLFLYYKIVRLAIIRKVKKEIVHSASGGASLSVRLQGRLHCSFTICNTIL